MKQDDGSVIIAIDNVSMIAITEDGIRFLCVTDTHWRFDSIEVTSGKALTHSQSWCSRTAVVSFPTAV